MSTVRRPSWLEASPGLPGSSILSDPSFHASNIKSTGRTNPSQTVLHPSRTIPFEFASSNANQKEIPTSSMTGMNERQTRVDKYAKDSVESFFEMTEDMRRLFTTWFSSAEDDLRAQWDLLRHDRDTFETHKIAETRRIAEEREQEMKSLDIQRQKNQSEQKEAIKKIKQERDEGRKQIESEKKVAEREFQSQKDTITRERELHVIAVTTFESEKQKTVDASLAAQQLLELNIGGTVFASSKSTICQQKGSFLDNLASGRHKVVKDKEDRIFLDRDPGLFCAIINFLRNPVQPPFAADAGRSRALVEEADFYGLKYFPSPLVYATGGHDGVNYLTSVELLDVEGQCWRNVQSMQTERAYAGSGVLGSNLYIFGGQNSHYRALCDNEVYDVLRADWFSAPSMAVPRRAHASASSADLIFAIGGYDGMAILDSVESLDERLKQWNFLAPLPGPRSAAKAVVTTDPSTRISELFLLGGTDGRRLNSMLRYDLRADRWETLPSTMLDVRSAGNAVAHLGHLYALGGLNEEHQLNQSMEVIDLKSAGSSWRPSTTMTNPRLDCASVNVNESFVTVGGHHENVVSNVVEFYRPELSTWQQGPRLNTGRYAHDLNVIMV